jgi:hypothetical protein
LQKRQSNQNALAPPLGASLWLGMPALRHCSVGPPRSAIHGRVAATPASMPGCPLRNTYVRPAWFNGAPRSKSKSKAEQSRAEQINSQAAFFAFLWELACLRWHHLGVPERPSCLHHRQASSHPQQTVPAFDLALASHHSSRPVGRCVLDLLLTLILGAPLNHAGRNSTLIWGVNRQDAGLAALGHGWPMAAAPQINVGLRAHRA